MNVEHTGSSLDYWIGFYKGVQICIEDLELRIDFCRRLNPMPDRSEAYKSMLEKMNKHREIAEKEIDKIVLHNA